MTRLGPPSVLPEQDYEAIEAAVMETARGRWFLAEFARRNRAADTVVLLQAIGKLHDTVAEQSVEAGVAKFRRELVDMADAIAQTKREIASMRPVDGDDGRIGEATVELDAIVEATEKATSEILFAAEQVQEIAWSAREDGTPGAVCDAIDAHVTEIYTACSFQDLTGQRTDKIVKVLRFIENRISAMISLWEGDGLPETVAVADRDIRPDAHLLNGPQRDGQGKTQDEINSLFVAEHDLDDVVFADTSDSQPPEPQAASGAAAQNDHDPGAMAAAAESIDQPQRLDADAHAPNDADVTQPAVAEPERDPAYHSLAIEQAAEKAIALPAAGSFQVFPRDDLTHDPASEVTGSEDGSAVARMGAPPAVAPQGEEAPQGETAVCLPSPHDLAGTAPEQPQAAADDNPAEADATSTWSQHPGQAALTPSTPRMPHDSPGDDVASLTPRQRIILFS